MTDIAFTVYGDPVPQGSTRAFIPKGWNRPVITAANSKTKPWRQQVGATAISEMGKAGLDKFPDEPMFVRVEFYFEKPKSVKLAHKTTKPDVDKLVRSILDALTGIAFRDDSQVVDLEAVKRYGSPARAEIRVGTFPFGAI